MPPADATEASAEGATPEATPAAPAAPAAAPAVPGVADEDLDVFGVNVNDVNGTGEPLGSLKPSPTKFANCDAAPVPENFDSFRVPAITVPNFYVIEHESDTRQSYHNDQQSTI